MPRTSIYKSITETAIKTLKPQKQEWYLKDIALKGFQIRVHTSGVSVYQVEARIAGKGRTKKFKLGNVKEVPLEEARKKAAEALKLIREGIDPAREKQKRLFEGMTLEELLQNYLDNRQDLKNRTREDYQYAIQKNFKPWLKRRVSEIHKHEVLAWYQNGKSTPTHTHGTYRVLHTLMEYAQGIEIITENPCILIKKKKGTYKIKQRDTYLEPNHDLGKFMKAYVNYQYSKDSQKCARDIILLMLTAGLRFGEARSITYSMIDFDRKVLTIPDTKNRRPHTAPLVAITFSMFWSRYQEHQKNKEKSPYVFPARGENTKSPHVTDIRKTLKGICEKADINEVTPHDLRRTFASVLNETNVGYADMKALMNHKTKDITAVYIQNNIEKLRKQLMEVVRYYDSKVLYPENRKAGLEDYGIDIMQSAFYENIEPTFIPLSQPKPSKDEEEDMANDYWFGTWDKPKRPIKA